MRLPCRAVSLLVEPPMSRQSTEHARSCIILGGSSQSKQRISVISIDAPLAYKYVEAGPGSSLLRIQKTLVALRFPVLVPLGKHKPSGFAQNVNWLECSGTRSVVNQTHSDHPSGQDEQLRPLVTGAAHGESKLSKLANHPLICSSPMLLSILARLLLQPNRYRTARSRFIPHRHPQEAHLGQQLLRPARRKQPKSRQKAKNTILHR